ncbi:hypothetical protein HBM09_004264 [Vibrio parahaemolyticus]
MTNSNDFFQLTAEWQQHIDWLNQVLKGGQSDSVLIDGVLKPSISKDIEDKWTGIRAMVNGRQAYKTKAELDAAGQPPSDKPLAEVWADPASKNNGLYGWDAGQWVRSKYDVGTLIKDLMRQFNDRLLPIEAAFLETGNVVHSRGTLGVGGSVIDSIFGWRSPFIHNGAPFDVIEIGLRIKPGNNETHMVVNVKNSNHDIIASGIAKVSSDTGKTYFVHLDRIVYADLDTVLYLEYYTQDLNAPVYYPKGGDYEPGLDVNVHREAYITANGQWSLASPLGNYRVTFSFYKSELVLDSGDLKRMQSEMEKIPNKLNVGDWVNNEAILYGIKDDTYTEYYSRSGLAAMMPYQVGEMDFNFVSVCGGTSSQAPFHPVIVRVYARHKDLTGNFIPENDAILIAEKTIYEWDSSNRRREVVFDKVYQVPKDHNVYVMWTHKEPNYWLKIAKFAHGSDEGDADYPRLPLVLSVENDAFGEKVFSDNSWGLGTTDYRTAPVVLGVKPKPEPPKYLELPPITIPSRIYCAVGTEANLYYDGFSLLSGTGPSSDQVGYGIQIHGPKGRAAERFWRFTPVDNDVGSHVLSASVFSLGERLHVESFIVNVISSTPPTKHKNILQLGDSLNSSGQVTSPLYENFNALGGVVPTFVGSVGTHPKRYEAFGGWKFQSFATGGNESYRFFVSGVGSIGIDDKYTHNGSSFKITEVNVTDGVGNINAVRVSGFNSPESSGTLTKSLGTGDASISFDSFRYESGNKLWNPVKGELDIENYREIIGLNEKIDIVTFQLGVNDVGIGDSLHSDEKITEIVNYAKAIIEAFKKDNPATKFLIGLPTTGGNTKDGYGINYGANYSKYHYELNIFNLRSALMNAFDNGAYGQNVQIGCTGISIDRYYGYGRGKQSIAARIPELTDVHTNAVHPITPGYEQIADAFFPQLLALVNE